MIESLSLVFPAYNEEANIEATVRAALKVGGKVAGQCEVVVVDDGSRDQTAALATKLAAGDARVRLVQHPHNQGYGKAVWDGLRAAKNEWVFFADADQQFDLQELTRLTAKVAPKTVVVGYRAPRRDPFMRLVNAAGWNFLVRWLLGLKLRDIDCAFKLMPREAIQLISVASAGAAFSPELMLRLVGAGYEIIEVPVTHYPRREGKQTGASFKVIKRAFRELLQLRTTTQRHDRS